MRNDPPQKTPVTEMVNGWNISNR